MGLLKTLLGPRTRQVTVQPAGTSFEVRSNQSILEAALSQGIAFPHSCTVGTCGSCKCRLTAGRIREISNFGYVLSAEELQGNIILACQAAARSDVELEVPGLSAHRLQPAADYTATLTQSVDLTRDIREITLKLDRPLRFDAGQYAQLACDSVYGARAYSFAMAPTAAGVEEVSFFVRHVPEGQFTDRLFAGELDGETLRLHGPCGNFWLRESRASMICVAGGSGLAPLLSMLEDACARHVGRSCVVLFGARTAADLYAEDRLSVLAQSWNGAFRFVPVLSDELPDSAWQGARGLVTTAIAEAARDLISGESEAYLCGPPGMIDAAIPELEALGIQAPNMHFDKFLDGSHGLSRQALG